MSRSLDIPSPAPPHTHTFLKMRTRYVWSRHTSGSALPGLQFEKPKQVGAWNWTQHETLPVTTPTISRCLHRSWCDPRNRIYVTYDKTDHSPPSKLTLLYSVDSKNFSLGSFTSLCFHIKSLFFSVTQFFCNLLQFMILKSIYSINSPILPPAQAPKMVSSYYIIPIAHIQYV